MLWHDLDSCAQRNQLGVLRFFQRNKDPVFLAQAADGPVLVALWGVNSTVAWHGTELSGQGDDAGVDQLLARLDLASLRVGGQDVCENTAGDAAQGDTVGGHLLQVAEWVVTCVELQLARERPELGHLEDLGGVGGRGGADGELELEGGVDGEGLLAGEVAVGDFVDQEGLGLVAVAGGIGVAGMAVEAVEGDVVREGRREDGGQGLVELCVVDAQACTVGAHVDLEEDRPLLGVAVGLAELGQGLHLGVVVEHEAQVGHVLRERHELGQPAFHHGQAEQDVVDEALLDERQQAPRLHERGDNDLVCRGVSGAQLQRCSLECLVRLHVRTEVCPELCCVLQHLVAVVPEDGPVHNEGRSWKLRLFLALVGLDERLLIC